MIACSSTSAGLTHMETVLCELLQGYKPATTGQSVPPHDCTSSTRCCVLRCLHYGSSSNALFIVMVKRIRLNTMTFIESNPSVDMIFFAFESLTDSNPILACGHAGALIIVVSDLPVKLLTLALNYRASFTLENIIIGVRVFLRERASSAEYTIPQP